MAIVRWQVTMSVDGFIAGADDAMDWVFRHAGPNPAVDAFIAATGAVLVGRRSYDVGQRATRAELREVAGGAWHGPQFVLTHDPVITSDDPTVTFVSGDIGAAVATTLQAAAGRDVGVIGADAAAQCVEHGLIDELLVHVAPILLGDGVRLFDRPGLSVDLETISAERAGQVTNLRYRVLGRARP